MAGGNYTINVTGILNDTYIRAKLNKLQKECEAGVVSATGTGSVGKGGRSSTTMISDAGKKIKQTNQEAKKMNSTFGKTKGVVSSAFSGFADITKKVVAFGAVTSAIQLASAGVSSMVTNVYDLDTALTEYKKVSNLTGKELDDMTDKAYKYGKEVGKTGTEMVQAATEFKKSGFNDDDALTLGKVAMMYTNIADEELTAGQAANFITSQMKAFNLKASDAEHIIDAVNEVSNNYAVSSADLATNIGKCSAAMADGGQTYEQTLGMMTAITEITRNGSTAARGLISIQSRYNQILDSSSSTGKKLTAWYKEHNIAIKDQNGQLKSFYEVGKKVAEQWDTLSDDEKKYYLNTQAGANQTRNLSALMNNYATAIKATTTAEGSSDKKSAQKENEKYLNSMKGAISRVKSAWEDLSRSLVDSGVLTGILKGVAKALELLSTDAGQAAIKIALFATGVGLASKVLTAFTGFSGLGGLIAKFGKTAVVAEEAAVATETTSTAWVTAGGALNGLEASAGGAAVSMAGLATPIGLAAVAVAGLAFAFSKIPTAEDKLKDGKKKLQQYSDKITNAKDKLEQLKAELETAKDSGKNTAGIQAKIDKTEEYIAKLEREKALQEEINRSEWVKTQNNPKKDSYSEQPTKDTQGRKIDNGQYYRKNVNNKGDEAINAYSRALVKAQNASDAYVKAQKKVNHMQASGETSGKKYEKALKNLQTASKDNSEAQTNLNKAQKKVTKTQKEWNKYGTKGIKGAKSTKKAMNDLTKSFNKNKTSLSKNEKSVKSSEKAIRKFRTSIKNGNGVLTKNGKLTKSATTYMQKFGKSMGVTVDKGGKISKLNVDKFTKSLEGAGMSASDVKDTISQIEQSNPDIEITSNVDSAKKDVVNLDQDVKGLPSQTVLGVTATVNGTPDVQTLQSKVKAIPKSKQSKVSAKTSGTPGVRTLLSLINSLKSKTINITTNRKTNYSSSGSSGGKNAHGTRNFYASGSSLAKAGNATVNEQGFEIIRDGRTGLMRVANSGLRGNTVLNRGDAVYTHGQSMRMLQKAGLTEAKLLQGKTGDVPVYGVNKLEGFAKGKLTTKQYKKKAKAALEDYQDAKDKLDIKRELYNWSDKKYQNELKNIRKTYLNKIKDYNKRHKGKDSYSSSRLTLSEELDYQNEFRDYYDEQIEANQELLSNNKKTYKEITDYIKTQYKKRLISLEEYQDALKEADETELDRIKTNYDNQYDYISQYIQRQIDKEQEENDVLEARAELLSAETQKVKVYKEGVGFVYEADKTSLKEAKNNLTEMSSVWEQIQTILEDAEADANLQKAGVLAGTSLVTAVTNAASNTSSWQNLITGLLANKTAYELADELGLKSTDVTKTETNYFIDTLSVSAVDAEDFAKNLQTQATQRTGSRS